MCVCEKRSDRGTRQNTMSCVPVTRKKIARGFSSEKPPPAVSANGLNTNSPPSTLSQITGLNDRDSAVMAIVGKA